ncbi:unnamed protein product, partial [Linum tenue]
LQSAGHPAVWTEEEAEESGGGSRAASQGRLRDGGEGARDGGERARDGGDRDRGSGEFRRTRAGWRRLRSRGRRRSGGYFRRQRDFGAGCLKILRNFKLFRNRFS